ncbi:MAG: type II 3-dehydroquinate dehydratase [Bacteroidetes bacterium]|nr:type II 3-dehydroquinate dehydratase [Bacteroidota bacterium]
MKTIIINGPNLNLLGQREPGIYGNISFDEYIENLRAEIPAVEITYFQSNIEGEIINELHKAQKTHNNIVINPGGYSHTSVAIADAIAAISIPVIEVHISNIHAREDYRQKLITGSKCRAVISGLGLMGYKAAIQFFLEEVNIKK